MTTVGPLVSRNESAQESAAASGMQHVEMGPTSARQRHDGVESDYMLRPDARARSDASNSAV